jgi:hypothetical protein
MAAYLTPSLFRAITPGAASISDEVAFLFLDATEKAIQTFLGFNPLRQTVTEFYSTDGEESLWLRRYPVAEIANVWEDRRGYFGDGSSSFESETLLELGEDYAAESGPNGLTGRLVRMRGRWPADYSRHISRLANHRTPCKGCVKIEYTAGWTTGVPEDVISEAYQDAGARFQTRGGLGAVTSVSLDGFSRTRGQIPGEHILDMESAPFRTPGLKAALLRYRRVPLA